MGKLYQSLIAQAELLMIAEYEHKFDITNIRNVHYNPLFREL